MASYGKPAVRYRPVMRLHSVIRPAGRHSVLRQAAHVRREFGVFAAVA